ncbi:MAG TPA: HD domain-containing phosphohydrolase [Phycisphaerae bacterium]|nr:HD domain-containing phosphohydrolase [Phycisphaerae bacterium]
MTMHGINTNTADVADAVGDPLAEFGAWAEPWVLLGLWVSRWDAQCELVEHTGPAGTFWKALIHHSHHFRNRLREFAMELRQGEPVVRELDPMSGMIVVAVPLKQRNCTAGCMVACGLSDAFFDEEAFARFCDNHHIDRSVFARIAATISRHSYPQTEALARLFVNHFLAMNTAALARHEISDLSSNLARTYEELNLLYRVSAGMSVSKKPAIHLEELCEELLGTTPVQGFAVVLEPPRYLSVKPTVVLVGVVDARGDEIVRLYQQVRDRHRNAGQAVVVDDARSDPAFAWATRWLRQFALYPLSKKDQHFGGILAVNHADNSQFDSYEIQLISALAERSTAFLENVQLYDDMEHLFSGLLHALVSSIDAKDPYTCGHSQRVAWLSRHVASLVGLPEAKCQRVYLSGLLHDIGKIGIAESVLCKTGRLTQDEFNQMKRHPEIGARILSGVPQVADTLPGILHHHERMDGKGYPAHLAGHDIPLLGRIIGLADAYDAMTTNRTYRKARPLQIAVAEIRRWAGTQFDPELADLFLRQDILTLHQELTEFGNQSIGIRAEINLGAGLAAIV